MATDYFKNPVFVPGGSSIEWNNSSSTVASNSATWSDPSFLRSTNLDAAKFGSNSFLDPDVKASFDGPQSTGYSSPYFITEKNGTVVGLRGGTSDGSLGKQYFATASTTSLTDLKNTDSEYRPTFLASTEYVSGIIDGNEHGFYCLIRSTTGAADKYYWIHINGTMNPAFHTYDDITTLASTTGINYWEGSIVYCKELDWWLTVYKQSGANLAVKNLTYKFFRRSDSAQMGATYTKSVGYVGASTEPFDVRITDSQPPTDITSFLINNTEQQRANLRYSVTGDNLLVSDLCSFFVWSNSAYFTFNYNSVFTYNTSASTFTEEYAFPHTYQYRGDDTTKVRPFFPYECSTCWWSQVKFNLRRSPNGNVLFTTYKDWANSTTDYKIKTYTIPSLYTWNDVLKRPYDPVNRPFDDVSSMITSIPTDASLLGKTLSFGYFTSPTKYRCLAYSKQATESSGSAKWVKCSFANINDRRNVLGGTNNGLGVPSSVELDTIADYLRPSINTLTSAGTMRLKRYDGTSYTFYEVDGDTMVAGPALTTLPSDWATRLDNLLASDSDYTGYTHRGSYLYHLTGNLFLHAFAYGKRTESKWYCSLLQLNPATGDMTWLGTKTLLETYTRLDIFGEVNVDSAYQAAGIYFADDGAIYVIFNGPLVSNHIQRPFIIKTNTARTDITSSKGIFDHRGSWHSLMVGVHPTFGPYLIYSGESGYAVQQISFRDKISTTDLNTRIVSCFDEALTSAAGLNWWGTDRASVLYSLTLQAATGFNVYSSETPVFLNGGYYTLPAASWSMSNSALWLDGVPSSLTNRTFNAYVAIIGGNPQIVFSQNIIADDPTRMYIGDITTSSSGVSTSTPIKTIVRLGSSVYTQKNGNVGIGTINPLYQLQLTQDSAAKPSSTTWTVASDERLKTDIELANNSLCYEIVKNLPLKRYTWKSEIYSDDQVRDRTKLGWIAQDVKDVFPKGVREQTTTFTPTSGQSVAIENCLSLDSDQIYAALYGATQKLMQTVEQQQEDIKNLKLVLKTYFKE